jgi:hypothetical protein
MPHDLTHHAGPVAVTLAYLALYYAFQINILFVKGRLTREYAARGEKFDRYFGQDRELLAADRVQLNMLEHMGPFLALLWLDAVFVGPWNATVAGAAYVAARGAYPLLMGRRLGRSVSAPILFSTVTGYAVLVWFFGAVLLAWISVST